MRVTRDVGRNQTRRSTSGIEYWRTLQTVFVQHPLTVCDDRINHTMKHLTYLIVQALRTESSKVADEQRKENQPRRPIQAQLDLLA